MKFWICPHNRLLYRFSRYLLIAILGALFFSPLWLYLSADRFSLSHIRSSLPMEPIWDISPLSEEDKYALSLILSQPFSYLAKGSQCFVFESKDQRYVLKFFRHERYRIPSWIATLSLPPFLDMLQKEKISQKELKRKELFRSCLIAYEELRNEAGLVFLHLNKTPCFQKKVKILDKLGRPYWIDLNEHEFIIQRKGRLIYSTFEKWISEGRIEAVKKGLSDLVLLLQKRYLMGISDHDAVLSKNAGFLEQMPIYLDIGQFVKDENVKDSSLYIPEIKKMTRKLHLWLEERDPTLAAALDEEIEKLDFFQDSTRVDK